MTRKCLCFIFLFLLIIYISYAQKVALKKYFTSLASNNQFNGNVLIEENGKIIYAQSFGYGDFDKKIPLNRNTSFPIASISKTLTATAILQLEEAGKLKVQDPIINYLKWFPYPKVTIQQLLSHSAGIPTYNSFFESTRNQQPEKIFTNKDFETGVLNNPKPLRFESGEKNVYDNVNFVVLALLIEELSGISYPEYINKHILLPAKMTNTKFQALGSQYQTINSSTNLARPYLYPRPYADSLLLAASIPYIRNYWTAYQFSGFGDYISTIDDLLKYDKAYRNGSLLKNSQLISMFKPVKLNNGTNGKFGLGWQLASDSMYGKVVYHNGNATGLSCILLRNLSKKQTIIIFDNIHGNNSESLGFAASKILNGETVGLPRQSIAAIYAKTLFKDGADLALKKLSSLNADTMHYYLSEAEMNTMGYAFLGGVNNPNPFKFPQAQKLNEALATFKLITQLFPNSWNAYDSYGEALLAQGKKTEAVKMYEKSIALNPQNEEGKKILAKLIN